MHGQSFVRRLTTCDSRKCGQHVPKHGFYISHLPRFTPPSIRWEFLSFSTGGSIGIGGLRTTVSLINMYIHYITSLSCPFCDPSEYPFRPPICALLPPFRPLAPSILTDEGSDSETPMNHPRVSGSTLEVPRSGEVVAYAGRGAASLGPALRFGLCRLRRTTMGGILTTRAHPVSSTVAHITRPTCASPLRHRRCPANSLPNRSTTSARSALRRVKIESSVSITQVLALPSPHPHSHPHPPLPPHPRPRTSISKPATLCKTAKSPAEGRVTRARASSTRRPNENNTPDRVWPH
jgi:hypothetical protein